MRSGGEPRKQPLGALLFFMAAGGFLAGAARFATYLNTPVEMGQESALLAVVIFLPLEIFAGLALGGLAPLGAGLLCGVWVPRSNWARVARIAACTLVGGAMAHLTYRLDVMGRIWAFPYAAPPSNQMVLTWSAVCCLCAFAWDTIERRAA